MSESSESKSSRYVPRALLVILRLHLGVILIITVLGKTLRSEPFSVEMLGFLDRDLAAKRYKKHKEKSRPKLFTTSMCLLCLFVAEQSK